MALWDGLFGKKDHAGEVKKLVTKATQKFGPPENRQEALQRLVALGTPEALEGMLARFTVRVDPGITDQEEKQYVFESLVEAGETAVAPLKAFIERSEHPTWALQALERLVPSEQVVAVILDALDREGPDWTRDPEKKCTLLRYLQQARDASIAPRLVPYFADPSEEVRSAAMSVVMEQEAPSAAHEPLVDALLAAAEQKSDRIRRQAAEALARVGASVKGRGPAVQAALPAGFAVDREGRVRGGK